MKVIQAKGEMPTLQTSVKTQISYKDLSIIPMENAFRK